MEEYNKELVSVLHNFEPEDIAILGDILKDLNEFNKFDDTPLKEIIKSVDAVIEENENSKLSKIIEDLNKNYLNQYIKYVDDDEIVLRKVINIIVDPAFGSSDFAIKFISEQAIYITNTGLDLKLFINAEDSYKPIILYSDLKNVEIIGEEEYYDILEKNNINIKR